MMSWNLKKYLVENEYEIFRKNWQALVGKCALTFQINVVLRDTNHAVTEMVHFEEDER